MTTIYICSEQYITVVNNKPTENEYIDYITHAMITLLAKTVINEISLPEGRHNYDN